MAKHLEAQAIEQAKGHATGGRLDGRSGSVIAIVVALAAGGWIFCASPLAFLAAVTDGVLAGAILAAATLAGLWIVWGTGNGDLPLRWQIGLGAGFGIGALSLGMLAAGLCGILGQGIWLGILAGLAAAGLAALHRLGQRQGQDATAQAGAGSGSATAEDCGRPAGAWRWLWLLVVPALVLGVLAATVPPGMLWHEEGNGFDVLEYHLGVPKEHFLNGRITYLDHNMYSNFPMNAEMLYLLTMVVHGDPWKAAVTAQMVHLLLGALAGYAAWLIGRDYSQRAGILAGIAGAAFPWSVYLGALAYVENGMLFYGLLAAGLCGRAMRQPQERRWQRALALGAMVGLACGYKYTAIPMIAVPLLGLWAALCIPRGRVSNAIIAVILAATMFAPWMIKNQWMTGNPVFPLAYPVFGADVWSDADHAKFVRGHSMLPEERPVGVRLGILWNRVIAEPRFGWMPWIAAGLAGWLAVRRRGQRWLETLVWLAILAGQMGLWLVTTHLFARFASVMWVPLVMLVAAVAAATTGDSQQQQGREPRGRGRGRQAEGDGLQPAASDSRGRRGNISEDTARSGARMSRRDNLGMAGCTLGLLVYLAVGQAGIWREYRQRLYAQGQLLPVQGNTELLYHGQVPGFDPLRSINGDGDKDPGLPRDAKLLMVNDVCGYYIDRRCDYYVTFSRNRFAEAIDEAGGDAGRVLAWLGRQGYTHVWASFVGMGEQGDPHITVPLQITPQLFAQLEKAGLKRLHEVRFGGQGAVYGAIYEVPRS